MADIGISSARFVKCIKSNKYLAWVSAVEKTAAANKIMAAPTVLIDGKEINRTTDYFNSAAFQAVVANPASIIAPTPKPTPSAYKLNFSVSKIYGVEPVIGKPSGSAPTTLGIGDLIVGTGNQIQSAQTVTVQYVLMEWTSGQVLESSWKSAPFTSSLANVIPGWQQGLLGMKVGGRRILIIPPDLAYGAAGSGSVGPNQTLVFVVDLLAVAK
jgi:peptidylprolyl isomerase